MEQTEIDLKDMMKTLKGRRCFIFNVVLGAIILALVISFLIPSTYEAETNLRVKQSKGLANSLLAELPVDSPINTKQLMATYAEILKSRTVVQAVIDKTQKGNNSDIPKYETMVKRITTQPVKDTEILKIKVEAESSEEAQLLANTLVETFNDRLTYLVRSEQAGVRDFIGKRVQESRLELEKTESALAEYKRNEKVLAPADETKAILERMTNVKKMIAENAVNAAVAEARYNTAERQLSAEKPGFIADSPLIQQYKRKLADLEVELVGVSKNYGDNHPRVQALKASIEESRQKLDVEAVRIINVEAPSLNPIHQGLLQSRIQAEAQIAASTAQQTAIGEIMRQSEEELKNLPTKEKGIIRLTRDAMVAQEIYVMLAKRFEEARISEFMQPTDVQVIDVAVAPEKPVFPKKILNVIIAMLLGTVFGTGIAFYQEYVNKTITNAKEAKQCLGLPVLGNIPDFSGESSQSKHAFWTKLKYLVVGK